MPKKRKVEPEGMPVEAAIVGVVVAAAAVALLYLFSPQKVVEPPSPPAVVVVPITPPPPGPPSVGEGPSVNQPKPVYPPDENVKPEPWLPPIVDKPTDKPVVKPKPDKPKVEKPKKPCKPKCVPCPWKKDWGPKNPYYQF